MIKQIAAGEWPTGRNEPLMVLPLSPSQLAEKFGLVFTEDQSDFEELDLGSTRDAVLEEFGLRIADIEWISEGWPRGPES